MLGALAIVSNNCVKFWCFLIALCSPKQFKNEGELFIVQGKAFESLNLWRNQAMEPHNPLPYSFKVYKEETMEKKKTGDENRGHSCSLLVHFWSTSRSPFSAFYIPFRSLESQESNGSNHVWFGAEMRKIWTSEDNCIKLRDNFAHHCLRCEILSPLCENFAHLKPTCEIGTQRAKIGYFCRLFFFWYFCV